jgi:hypothetical protein
LKTSACGPVGDIAALPRRHGRITTPWLIWGDADLLGIPPKYRTEPENAVSGFLHFQRLTPLKMAGRPVPHGKRQ